VSKLFGELLVALLIVIEILCLSLTLLVARKLWGEILMLARFKRMDLEFAGAGNRDYVLYWRRDKVKISLYLALDVFYAGVGLTAALLAGFGLLRAFGTLR